MKGITNFIIEVVNPYNDTFKTESGLELHANVDFSADRLSNRIAKVTNAPLLHDNEIKQGYEVLFDPSMFRKQIYRGVKQEYQNAVDESKNLYFIDPDLIICYRKTKEDKWTAYRDNCIVEPIYKTDSTDLSALVEVTKEKQFSGIAKIVYVNKKLKDLDIQENDNIVMNPKGGIPYWLDGKEYWQTITGYIYAKSI